MRAFIGSPRWRLAIRTGLLAAAAAAAIGPAAAEPVDWRYCLSVSRGTHRAYMTLPFATDEPLQSLQDAFAAALAGADLPFDTVQCPRGDARAIAAMRQHAVRYNRLTGNTVITLDWRP